MNIKTFIDRPVLSSVISIVIVLGGIIGLAMLPIERYPNIAPPTIRVQAKVRYSAKASWATAEQTDTDKIRLLFDEPQRAVTEGQYAVFGQYDFLTVDEIEIELLADVFVFDGL